MATKFFSEKNLKFMLYDVFDVLSLTKLTYFKEHNRKVFDMVLDAAAKMAKKLFFPILEEMDRNPPELIDGVVKVHPAVKQILRETGEGGWITIAKSYEQDGEQLPLMVSDSCNFIFQAANYSAGVYHGLCAGAAHLIESFGSKELNEIYVAKMNNGIWQGTMALTEPQAGSSLSDIESTAHPTEEGYYKIKGQKIFISAGDHDAADNIIHLMMARIDGAPVGVKGISLFVVPKKRLDQNGNLGSNDVITSGIYHKMGYRGAPIAQLSFGDNNDCHGYLVGEPNKGLSYMFQMMNEARLGVGLGATAIATAAYYASLEYCQQRAQGRKIDQKDPSKQQIPIIEHADVKRLLLFQRSVIEGSLSLLLQCCKYADLKQALDGEEQVKYALLLDLLTPVAKSYPSEMGILSVSNGLQCLGGSGFCDDYPLEQYYRDMRIHPIHEGTTTIHGLDILGRKVTMKNGRAFRLFQDEVNRTLIEAEEIPELGSQTQKLKESMMRLVLITEELITISIEKGVEMFLSDATLYLELFGIVTIGWQWLVQGITVQKLLNEKCTKKEREFLLGKRFTMQYYFSYELPKTGGLIQRLEENDGLTVKMEPAFFND